MLGDHGFEHILPRVFREARCSPRRVHQPAVADYIGREDRGEPTLNALFGHLRIKCGSDEVASRERCADRQFYRIRSIP